MDDFSEPIQPADWSRDPEAEPLRTRLPTGLKVIGIIAILVGIGGTLAGLLRGVGLLVGPAAQASLNPASAELSAEAQELQQRMQAEINAIAGRYVMWSVMLVTLQLGSAMLLLIGGLLALQAKELGRRMLLLACGIATLYVVADGVVHALIQWESIPVVRQMVGEVVGEVARASSNTARQADEVQVVVEMAPRLVLAAIYVGLAVSALLLLVKLVFYTCVVVYLRRPRVRAVFGMDLAPAGIA